MRRSGSRATTLAAEAGVSARQIESWTQAGLGPLSSATHDQEADHFRTLAGLVGPGRGNNADRAALRLAARGFPSERLRGALLRTVGISEVGEAPVLIDLDDDAVFAALEEYATSMIREIHQAPAPLKAIIREVCRNVKRVGAESGESRDDLLRSAFINLMCILLGGRLYDLTAIAAMFGVSASDLDPTAVDQINSLVGVTVWEIDDTYRSVDLQTVATAAAWLRGNISEAFGHIGVQLSDAVIDQLAAIAAPFLIRLVWLFASDPRFGEGIISESGLPREILVPQRSLAELQAG